VGNWNIQLRRPREAEAAYTVAVALAPRSQWPRYYRGLLYLELKEYSQALEDFDQLVALQPELPAPYLNRALAKLGLGDAQGAIEDVTACLGLKGAPSRSWFIRADAKRRLGDFAGSKLDREEGLKHLPDEPAGFVARGLARLPADPRGALADFDAALAIEPFNREALQDKASVLGETLGQGEEALKVLDTLILHHPENYEAICGRGVQLARFGRRDAAIRDARAALAINTGAQTVYQVACIYSLLSRKEPSDRAEALRRLAAALRQDDSWLAIARRDPDMAPVRNDPAFQELLKSFQVVQRAGKK
jgi:tetratricopeptide (TPR) repeat protein